MFIILKRLGLFAVLMAFLAPLALQTNVLDRFISISGSELGESGVIAAGKGLTTAEQLATKASEARAGGFFERELQCLQGKGYTVELGGTSLLPPVAP